MSFTTRELIFIALMAALLFVVNFTIGAGIIAVTGIPGGSGLVTGISNLLVITFVALLIRRFGAIALLYFVYGILALPTDMAGGPPGFVWKIPLLVLASLFFELCVFLAKHKKIGFILGLPAFTLVGLVTYLFTYWVLGMPELNKALTFFPVILVALLVLGYVGMWLGFVLYARLKNKRLIQQITA